MNNKLFQRYFLIWLISLAAFNVICFVVPAEIAGVPRITGSFWTAYAFITIAFLGQLVCAWFALKADSLTKLFYNMPLLTICRTGLILMLVIGSLFMLVPFFPKWLGVILCFLILAFTAIAVIKANTAAEIVQNTETRIRKQTSTMRELTAQAESLIYQAKSEEAKAECQKVYDALRYSDPMASPALSDIENSIFVQLKEFASLIKTDNEEVVKKESEELLIFIQERNQKCKVLK
ncbi:MAG: hypothetical protein IJI14_19850 [Anaerolineaceae bacterium]|nr:hypothetical protein [Anaerolineaceae bacterium]